MRLSQNVAFMLSFALVISMTAVTFANEFDENYDYLLNDYAENGVYESELYKLDKTYENELSGITYEDVLGFGNIMPRGLTREITFVFQNGAGNPNIYVPQTTTDLVYVGESPKVPREYEPRRGWYFAGWYKGISPDWIPYHPGNYIVGDYDRTFTARFNQLWWDIIFIVEEGGVHEGITVHTERDGFRLPGHHWGTPPLPTIPSVEASQGYIFTGWHAVAADGTRTPLGYDLATALGLNHPVLHFPSDFAENFTFVATFRTIEKPTIAKAANPNTNVTNVTRGSIVTYRFVINAGDFTDFENIKIVDVLNEFLIFNPESIVVSGALDWDYEFYAPDRRLTIYNIELEYCPIEGYADEVIITFTVRVASNAPRGAIDNTVRLLYVDQTDPTNLIEFDSAEARITIHVPRTGGNVNGGNGDNGDNGYEQYPPEPNGSGDSDVHDNESVNVEAPQVPLAGYDEEEVSLPEPAVPLGDIPQTNAANSGIGWVIVSLMAIGALALATRKRKYGELA